MSIPRQPHAVLDLPSRYQKALKIERLLDLATLPQPIRMLEIGTGSGGIAHYFATHSSLNIFVTAVDVRDQRLVTEGYQFVQVQDVALPFAAESFDVVISNHVIEHVGDSMAQHHHLCELRRVMKCLGVAYVAAPNRWMLVEPHFHLAFLSWLPRALRTPYLRLMRKGKNYDCNPPTLGGLKALLTGAKLSGEYLSTKALRETLLIERNLGAGATLAAHLPDACLNFLARINPTLIFKASRSD